MKESGLKLDLKAHRGNDRDLSSRRGNRGVGPMKQADGTPISTGLAEKETLASETLYRAISERNAGLLDAAVTADWQFVPLAETSGRWSPMEMMNESSTGSQEPKGTATCANGYDVQYRSVVRVRILHSDPFIAAGLEAVLQKRRDLKVVIAGVGSESANLIGESAEADVVIADYESGLRLSEAGRESHRRVVILTQSDGEAQICHALKHGARGYLLLGCSPEDVVEAIRSVCQGGVALAPFVARRITENMKQVALTSRQKNILRQLMLGLSNKRIAVECSVTEGTVKTHVKAILAKLNATSRTEAIAIAHRRGL
jgi:DNA-binding NarL/FixJ family response regulator